MAHENFGYYDAAYQAARFITCYEKRLPQEAEKAKNRLRELGWDIRRIGGEVARKREGAKK